MPLFKPQIISCLLFLFYSAAAAQQPRPVSFGLTFSVAANYEDGVFLFAPGLGLTLWERHFVSAAPAFGSGFGGGIHYRFSPSSGVSRFKPFISLSGLYFLRYGSGLPGALKVIQVSPGVGFAFYPSGNGFNLFYQNGVGFTLHRGPIRESFPDFQMQIGLGYDF